jgi:large subunit ribosomal protein L17
MRHNKKVNHLGRQAGHRKALMSNMASSLILHKRIETTLAKAKALRKYVEPLITKSKEDTTHSRRVVFSYLKDKYAVTELFREIAPRIADRPGGYTRILHTGFRLGDAAEMCIIELVDFNATYVAGAAGEAKGRTRRGGAKKAVVAAGEENTTEAAGAAVTTEGKPAEKKPVKKAPAKASPAKKPAPKNVPAQKVSGAKTKAVKTAASKKA